MSENTSTWLPLSRDPKNGRRILCVDSEPLMTVASTSPAVAAFARAEVIVRAVNSHDDLMDVAERVAEHFIGTDSPLGVAARAAIRKSKGAA